MKSEDTYLKFVRWSDEEGFYVGYCPDLFPWGGVCHSATEEETYAALCVLVREEIEDLLTENRDLPPAETRPIREASRPHV
jgi:hypothetical protein